LGGDNLWSIIDRLVEFFVSARSEGSG
jgi:hypothetical protein